MRSLRKFPKEVKALPICHVLEERMREFKESIPLFADLKNDALRERFGVHSTSMNLSLTVSNAHQTLAEAYGVDQTEL